MKKNILWIVLVLAVVLFALLFWFVLRDELPQVNQGLVAPVQEERVSEDGASEEANSSDTGAVVDVQAQTDDDLRTVVDPVTGETFAEPVAETDVPAEEPDPADQDIQ